MNTHLYVLPIHTFARPRFSELHLLRNVLIYSLCFLIIILQDIHAVKFIIVYFLRLLFRNDNNDRFISPLALYPRPLLLFARR